MGLRLYGGAVTTTNDAANQRALADRIIWIDCEMTGLSLRTDALVEVAALVTDYELTVLGDGIDVVIKPPAEAIEQMEEFVRDMHTTSGLLAELDRGVSLAEAQSVVLDYVREFVPEPRKAPLGGNSVATDRASSPATCRTSKRICTTGSSTCHRSRSCPAAGIRGCTSTPEEGRRTPRAGRHQGVDRGAALLPRGRVRAAARAGQRDGQGPRGDARRRALKCGCRTEGCHEHSFRPCTIGVAVRSDVVGVAQLVEHLVVVQVVAGSSPVTHPG